ncbi:Glutaredoxin 3, partial [Kappamyces sp. JEL0680]
MNEVFQELSRVYPALTFVQLQAEEFPDISEELEIETVPTFVLLRNGKAVEKIDGANAPALTQMAAKFASMPLEMVSRVSDQTSPVDLEKKLKTLTSSHPIMLFMKGTPSAPKCGFSRQTVEILADLKCTYGSFDILSDEEVRAGLKTYSDWPTYPQIYVNGELVGGLDILKEMVANGEFQAMIPKEEDLNTRLGKLVKKAPVM